MCGKRKGSGKGAVYIRKEGSKMTTERGVV